MADGITEPVDPDEDDLVDRAWNGLKRARTDSSAWRKEAVEAYAFRSGDQFTPDERKALEDASRPPVVFNRLDPIISAVAGTEVANRQEVRYLPRNMGVVQVNEVATGGVKWVRDQCDAEDEESEAFTDMITCGMGWTNTRIDYDIDPDGEIIIEQVDPLEMYWPRRAAKRNLRDARELWRLSPWSRAEVKAQWPDKYGQITEGGLPWGDDDDGDIHEQPTPQDSYNRTDDSGKQPDDRNELFILEYQWCEMEPVFRIKHPQSGQLETLDEDKFGKLKDAGLPLQEVDPDQPDDAAPDQMAQLQYVKQKQLKHYRAYFCGKLLLSQDEVPGKSGFSYKAMTGKRDRNKGCWYGLIRGMKDPQRWANKFFSQFMHIINSNAKGGVLAEAGAVANWSKFEDSWAEPDSVIQVNEGALQKGAIASKAAFAAPYPQGIQNMMEFAISAIRDVSGVSLELLGMADRDQPGVLEYQRKQAGLTILAQLFDSLRLYRKEQGRLLLGFVNEFISDGRLVRLMGPDGDEQFVRMEKQDDTLKYDIIVDSAPTSPNMKEQVFQAMTQLLPTLAKMGIPPPKEALDYAPFPSSLIQKWKQQIDQQPQIPPQVQQQMDAAQKQMQALQADNEQLQQTVQALKADKSTEQAKAQADVQLKAAQFHSDQQLEQIKAASAQQLAEQKMQLEQAKAAHDMELKRRMAEFDMELETRRAESAAEAQAIKDGRPVKPKAPKKRNVKIHRDPQTQMATHLEVIEEP